MQFDMSSARRLRNRAVLCDEYDEAKSTGIKLTSRASKLENVAHKSKNSCEKLPNKNLRDVKTHKSTILKLQNLSELNAVGSNSNKCKQPRSKLKKCIQSMKEVNSNKGKVSCLKIIEATENLKTKIQLHSADKENQSTFKKNSRKVKNIDKKENHVSNSKRKCTSNEKSSTNNKVALKVLSENRCPIWNKFQFSSDTVQQSEKKISKGDVYDITEDQEIMEEKTKKRKLVSRPRKRNYKKRTLPKPVNVKNFKMKHGVTSASPIMNNENNNHILNDEANSLLVSKNENKLSNIFPEETKKLEATHVISDSTQTVNKNMVKFPKIISEEMKKNYSVETVHEKPHDKESNFVSCMLATKCKKSNKKQFLKNFAHDIEESFTFPKMTSTPDNFQMASKDICYALNNRVISEISAISYVRQQSNETVITPIILSPEQSVNEENSSDDETEITLFESPSKSESDYPKKSIQKISSPIKSLKINLFEENLAVSPIKVNSRETEIKPKKGYHTPEQFRKHLSKCSKIAGVDKQKIKTKQDKLCEEMNKQFEEISSFELCIE